MLNIVQNKLRVFVFSGLTELTADDFWAGRVQLPKEGTEARQILQLIHIIDRHQPQNNAL